MDPEANLKARDRAENDQPPMKHPDGATAALRQKGQRGQRVEGERGPREEGEGARREGKGGRGERKEEEGRGRSAATQKPTAQSRPRFSYARAAAGGSGPSGRRGISAQELADMQLFEDESFLKRFYETVPEEMDPRQRFVIRMQYKGQDPSKVSREYVCGTLLKEFMGAFQEEILAVIIPPGSKEIDICLVSESAYQRFWDLLRVNLRITPQFLQEYTIIPLFRGETRVLTVSFRTTIIPPKDVSYWLSRRCRVLMEPNKKVDEYGYWTGEYRAIVGLNRDALTGRIRHLPKYFFLGAGRGVARYGGQPPACFRCGGYDHLRRDCPSSLCSKCGTRGHDTGSCTKEVSCSLCAKRGHVYRFCPESELNLQYPEAFRRDWERACRAKMAAEQRERESRDRAEAGSREGGAAGPTGAAGGGTDRWENVRKGGKGDGPKEAVPERGAQAGLATANRYTVFCQDMEEPETVETVDGESGQGAGKEPRKGKKRQKEREHTPSPRKEAEVEVEAAAKSLDRRRQGGKKVRREKEAAVRGQEDGRGELRTELYQRQRKWKAELAAMTAEREWCQEQMRGRSGQDFSRKIQALRERQEDLETDLEIVGVQLKEFDEEDKRAREEREKEEADKPVGDPPHPLDIPGDRASPPDPHDA